YVFLHRGQVLDGPHRTGRPSNRGLYEAGQAAHRARRRPRAAAGALVGTVSVPQTLSNRDGCGLKSSFMVEFGLPGFQPYGILNMGRQAARTGIWEVTTMVRHALVLVMLVGLAQAAPAAPWADALFDNLSHDFGTVPRGPHVTHHFTVTNTTGAPLHITSVRVSCGC